MKLKEFLETYKNQIIEKIEKNLTPIYTPGTSDPVADTLDPKLALLKRKPLPAQKELIKAVSKAMSLGKRNIFITGEMGSGKTMISLSIVHMLKPSRTLVICPTHLVEKWKRETKDTIPNVKVIDLNVKNVITILQELSKNRKPPASHEVYIISKEKAKLGFGWKPAGIRKGQSNIPRCPDCGSPAKTKDEYLTWHDIEKKRHKCQCGSPLWQANNNIRRYAPSEFIKKHMKYYFDVLIIDEVQDYKAGNTLQGQSMGNLINKVKYCLCLTGTLNGGYAEDLFYLLYRMAPKELKKDKFEYGSTQKWTESYGVIERVYDIKEDEKDKYYGRTSKKKVRVYKKPGVSPVVIGKYLLDKSVFIRLTDIIDSLPPYKESVITIPMNNNQKKNYKNLEEKLRNAVKKHGTRVLSSMLQALLSYPDSCTVFPEKIYVKNRMKQIVQVIEAPMLNEEITPKEEKLIEIVRNEKANNRKVLCYLVFTNTRDIRPRLIEILKKEGFNVEALDASIDPKRREAWIKEHAKNVDILLVNAELVKTGLDLYDFPTVIFYQTGYNIFTLRQAARRSWRIGQTKPVEVYFMAYKDTMQDTAISLIAKKLETALLVEGDLPEGLAEYTTEQNSLVEELGKALVESKNFESAESIWAKLRKKEIEMQLNISPKNIILSEKTATEIVRPQTDILRKQEPEPKKDNVIVKITIITGKKANQSVIEVKYSDLDKIAKENAVQFAMF